MPSTPIFFELDVGRDRDTGSDSDSVASGHVTAYFAAGQGKVHDDSDEDDDDGPGYKA